MTVLRGIHIRLNRACEHFDALGSTCISIIDNGDYGGLHAEFDEVLECHRLVFRQKTALPQRLGVMVGDYVHSLRSSLDNLVTHLVERNGKRASRNNAFPIYARESDWKRKVISPRDARLSPLYRVSAPDIAIIKGLQPYCGRDETAAKRTDLAVINRISNADKHRALHVTRGAIPQFGERRYRVNPPGSVTIEECWAAPAGTLLNDGTEVAHVRFSSVIPEENVEVYPEYPIGVSFADYAGNLVGMPQLRNLWFAVIDIVARWDESVRKVVPPRMR